MFTKSPILVREREKNTLFVSTRNSIQVFSEHSVYWKSIGIWAVTEIQDFVNNAVSIS